MSDKLDFPATRRNADAILEVLAEHLPAGNVLEIASGSGQHAVFFAEHLPLNTFVPSDPDPVHRQSIMAWRKESQLGNVLEPIAIDTEEDNWISGHAIKGLPDRIHAILCCNMIHIAPISAAYGLFAGAAHRLHSGDLFYLYGPFLGAAKTDAPSNLEFDADLKRRNAAWGVRHINDVKQMAAGAGFVFDEIIPMPANNFSVLFRRN